MTQNRTRVRLFRLGLVLTSLFVGVIGWYNRAIVLHVAADLWIVSDSVENAEAVAVLGGGINTRPFAAADLYNAGRVQTVLVASVRPARVEQLQVVPPNTEIIRGMLIKLKVPPLAIVEIGRDVSNTYDEARAVRDWAKNNNATKIIVITEMFSSRRVRWIFNRELSSAGVKVIIHPVLDPDYAFERWWQDERGIVQFQNEVLKYLYYRYRY